MSSAGGDAASHVLVPSQPFAMLTIDEPGSVYCQGASVSAGHRIAIAAGVQ